MSTTKFRTKANPQQQQAIETTDGPLLIIAGPGSGKTFTLVERVVYLILHENATPESLFVATFTDKAAQELRTRVSNRLAELGVRFNLNDMYLGTFHSICLRWLLACITRARFPCAVAWLDQPPWWLPCCTPCWRGRESGI